jgi:hypothetical protein
MSLTQQWLWRGTLYDEVLGDSLDHAVADTSLPWGYPTLVAAKYVEPTHAVYGPPTPVAFVYPQPKPGVVQPEPGGDPSIVPEPSYSIVLAALLVFLFIWRRWA